MMQDLTTEKKCPKCGEAMNDSGLICRLPVIEGTDGKGSIIKELAVQVYSCPRCNYVELFKD
jgi:ribosomal protein S27AE